MAWDVHGLESLDREALSADILGLRWLLRDYGVRSCTDKIKRWEKRIIQSKMNGTISQRYINAHFYQHFIASQCRIDRIVVRIYRTPERTPKCRIASVVHCASAVRIG